MLSYGCSTTSASLTFPLGEEYNQLIELTLDLMNLGKIDMSKLTPEQNEFFWYKYWNNPILQRFIKTAEETFQKHVPFTKPMKNNLF